MPEVSSHYFYYFPCCCRWFDALTGWLKICVDDYTQVSLLLYWFQFFPRKTLFHIIFSSTRLPNVHGFAFTSAARSSTTGVGHPGLYVRWCCLYSARDLRVICGHFHVVYDPGWQLVHKHQQEAQLSQRGRAMLRVCLWSASTYFHRSFLLLVTAASDLLVLKFLLNSVLLSPIVSGGVRPTPPPDKHP